ncbi:MAG TPA: hypothetical protein VN907_06850, partial [Actinomycetes bacterium]|nr:hypothetical protein [Actinomycetes bacterium]
MLLDAFLGYEANACPGRHTNVHPARHLLEMIPAPVCAAVTARVSNRVMVTGRLRQRSWETPEGE